MTNDIRWFTGWPSSETNHTLKLRLESINIAVLMVYVFASTNQPMFMGTLISLIIIDKGIKD